MSKFRKLKVVGIFIVIIYASYILINQGMIVKRQNEEIAELNKTLSTIKEENLLLKDKMQMNNNNKYVERMAREKLGLVKEGEEPIIIINNMDEKNKENKDKDNK